MTRKRTLTLALGSVLFLSACENNTLSGFLKSSDNSKNTTAAPQASAGKTKHDVEAPDIFKMAENGLWDGRPSLGGVWVAHPDVKDPERVVIRNQTNGKSVVGALFRRERNVPGPRFQVSSDAAVELGMLAGAPVALSVTALRKTDAPGDVPASEKPTKDGQTKHATTQDPIAAAAAALDKTEAASAQSAALKKTGPKLGRLSKPYVQLGIFSLEENAKNTAEAIRQSGMSAVIKPGQSNGKGFWRVLAGPAANRSDRAALLKKIKALGFADAYFVSR